MKAEFEEKQYEQHLNAELLQGGNLFFPPGQVLEHTLGFDIAMFTRNPVFWGLFRELSSNEHGTAPVPPHGIKLPKTLWQTLDAELNHLPPFRFNVFIQHKRPEYMNRANAAEWPSWNSAYYRYNTMPHQQDALLRLEKKIADAGIVVYACPAFHTSAEFWENVRTQSVLTNSNFCQPAKLVNHERFTFQGPGSFGIAHSEPEKVESYQFVSRINELRARAPMEDNRRFLQSLGEMIDAAMLLSDHFAHSYTQISQDLLAEVEDLPAITALIKLDVFRFLTRSVYFIGT